MMKVKDGKSDREFYFNNLDKFYFAYKTITRDGNCIKGCPVCRGTTKSKIDEYCYCDGTKKNLIVLQEKFIVDPWNPIVKTSNGIENNMKQILTKVL